MRSYNEHEKHSVEMVNIKNLSEMLGEIHSKNRIDYVIESGTNKGTGSTKMLAEAFRVSTDPPRIKTIEANWRNWKKAAKNLKQYPFVEAIWGFSVPGSEAIDFVKNDDALLHHEKYPDIFIDGNENPMQFYLNELSGKFGSSRFKLLNLVLDFFESIDRKTKFAGEDLLRKYLAEHKDSKPMIVLDSSGAIGFLEFSIVKEAMDKSPFYLLIDDIFHLKHFRSYEHIKNDPAYKILMLDEDGGWVFAEKAGS
jgi:hypothetical protein